MAEVTSNQVKEMIDQLAAMTAAASITPEIVASIFEKMRNLNDQEREKVIKVATEYIEEIRETGVDAYKCRTNNGSNVQEELDTLGSVMASTGNNNSGMIETKVNALLLCVKDLITKIVFHSGTPYQIPVELQSSLILKRYSRESSKAICGTCLCGEVICGQL